MRLLTRLTHNRVALSSAYIIAPVCYRVDVLISMSIRYVLVVHGSRFIHCYYNCSDISSMPSARPGRRPPTFLSCRYLYLFCYFHHRLGIGSHANGICCVRGIFDLLHFTFWPHMHCLVPISLWNHSQNVWCMQVLFSLCIWSHVLILLSFSAAFATVLCNFAISSLFTSIAIIKWMCFHQRSWFNLKNSLYILQIFV